MTMEFYAVLGIMPSLLIFCRLFNGFAIALLVSFLIREGGLTGMFRLTAYAALARHRHLAAARAPR
jgi:hypothetical protein